MLDFIWILYHYDSYFGYDLYLVKGTSSSNILEHFRNSKNKSKRNDLVDEIITIKQTILERTEV